MLKSCCFPRRTAICMLLPRRESLFVLISVANCQETVPRMVSVCIRRSPSRAASSAASDCGDVGWPRHVTSRSMPQASAAISATVSAPPSRWAITRL